MQDPNAWVPSPAPGSAFRTVLATSTLGVPEVHAQTDRRTDRQPFGLLGVIIHFLPCLWLCRLQTMPKHGSKISSSSLSRHLVPQDSSSGLTRSNHLEEPQPCAGRLSPVTADTSLGLGGFNWKESLQINPLHKTPKPPSHAPSN